MPKPMVHPDRVTEMMFSAAFADIEEIRSKVSAFFAARGTQQGAQQELLRGGTPATVLVNIAPNGVTTKGDWEWTRNGVPLGPFQVGRSFVGSNDYVT